MNQRFRPALPLLLLLTLVIPVFAQPPATESKPDKAEATTQKWFGTLDLKVARLRLLLEITDGENGNKKATVYSVDQGNAEMPADTFSQEDGKLKFTIDKVKASFEGDVSADGKSIKGTFTQFGTPHDLTLKLSDGVPKQEVIAAWVGDLRAGGQTLRVQVRELESDGERIVVFDSLTQRSNGLTATKNIDGDKVTIEVPAAQAKYEAKLNATKDELTGTWKQLGQSMELTLKKVDKAEESSKRDRPQTPKEPFSYQSEDVQFENKPQNVTLAGTLTYPSGDGPFPAVVLISGSGPQNRDEELLGHRPFAVLADHLTKHGIAVLRYDDRGVAKSTGSFSDSTSADFAKDAGAAIDFLKAHGKIDAEHIGLVGHSEGGLISAILAAQRDDLDHAVLMAGPGVSGDKIIIDQSVAISRASGATDEYLKQDEAMMRELVEAAQAGALDQKRIDEILEKYPLVTGGKEESFLATQLKQFDTPWFQYFLRYNPGADLAKARCPILALLGEKDLQVTTTLNAIALQKALQQSGVAGSRYVELPGLNHLFQPCTDGSPGEYDMITKTLDESFLNAVTEWVLQHAGA